MGSRLVLAGYKCLMCRGPPKKKKKTQTGWISADQQMQDFISYVCSTGGRHSSECTLILTEGDSAKSLAVSGLGVIGRDRYGVFPLRGKILNVREATHKQVRHMLTTRSG